MRSLKSFLSVSGLLAAFAGPALAQDAVTSQPDPAPRPMPAVILGLRAGALFGQPFSSLGTTLHGELQIGAQLPVLDRKLGVFAGVGYSQPKTSGTIMGDARLPGGMGTYETTVRDLGISLGASLWIPAGARLLPYGQIGGKLHLYRNDAVGTGGTAAFGENREPKTRAGFMARAGIGYRLGPGALTGDLTLDSAPVREVITGKSNAGDLVIALGYSLLI